MLKNSIKTYQILQAASLGIPIRNLMFSQYIFFFNAKQFENIGPQVASV